MRMDYWHKRSEDMFQVLDWFIQFVHWSEGGMLWRVVHHI